MFRISVGDKTRDQIPNSRRAYPGTKTGVRERVLGFDPTNLHSLAKIFALIV